MVLVSAYFLIIWQEILPNIIGSRGARDYASYHYAVHAVVQEIQPYDVENLNLLAQQDGTRKEVHPFFYPPPSILPLLWTRYFSLSEGYVLLFWLNQLLVFISMYYIQKALRISWVLILSMFVLFFPVFDTMKMGQINIFILALLAYTLYTQSVERKFGVGRAGISLAVASMTKMSPALLFFQWCAQSKYKMVLYCASTCVLLTFCVLPWMNVDTQMFFYTHVLPSFASGEYAGLQIPINLPANHSIPNILYQCFPENSTMVLSAKAKLFSSIINVSIFVSMLVFSRKILDKTAQYYVSSAWICVMLLFPVYTYEHHLVLLLLPMASVLHATQKSSKHLKIGIWLSFVLGGLPIFTIRALQKTLPILHWWLQETKFFYIIYLFVLCLCFAWKQEKNLRENNNV